MIRAGILAMALALTTGLAAPLAQSKPLPPLRAILVRAAAYLDGFQRDFALIVSDEDYRQQIGSDVPPVVPKSNIRDTKAEMVFLWVPEERLWITARNVLTVDGEPVPDSERAVDRALASADGRVARVRRLRSDTARYNLGNIYRNFNDPTFTLQFLDAELQGRFRWELRDTDRIDGVETVQIDFEERAKPTIVRHNGGSLPSRGTVWVGPFTGVVHRTRLLVRNEAMRTDARIEVEFALESRLGMVVPVKMQERYAQATRMQVVAGGRQRWVTEKPIFGFATYSNFRRFETSGRLVDPAR